MGNVIEFIKYHLRMTKFSLPSSIRIIDIVQILLIAIFVYYLMVWIKNTRAYTLLKGVLIVSVFLIIAAILRMDTILWICQQLSVVAITGVLVIFQPELRRALEQLGEKKMLSNLIPFDSSKQMDERITDRTIGELIHAAYAMGEVKTGALIVVEQNIILQEYEKTGIAMDSLISSQLLINIFEHNTPLHDGAVIVRNNRIVSATCYLPLSDNLELNKSGWFPRVEGSEMNFYLVEQKEDLQPGAYGILEPTGEYKADGYDGLLIMPGVAFDEECHRIGYGGGFYDKYLEKHPDLHTIAVAFELQMYRELPFEEHDIKPEKVITEKHIYPLESGECFL